MSFLVCVALLNALPVHGSIADPHVEPSFVESRSSLVDLWLHEPWAAKRGDPLAWRHWNELQDGPVPGQDTPDHERLAQPTRSRDARRFEISILHQDVDLNSYTYDLLEFQTESKIGEVEYSDATQVTTELRFRFGPANAGGYIDLYGQTTESDSNTVDAGGVTVSGAPLDLDLAGFSLGFDGFGAFTEKDVSLGLDYSVGFGLLFGTGTVLFFDQNTPGFFFDDDADVLSLRLDGRLGLGVDIRGLHVSGGFVGAYESIAFDTDAFISTTVDGDFSNSGAYLRAWYRSDAAPLCGGVQAFFGDIEGFLVGIGLHL